MSKELLKGAIDFYEQMDRVQQCPSYPDLQEKWLEDVWENWDSSIPWEEIDTEAERGEAVVKTIEDCIKLFVSGSSSAEWSTLTVDQRRAHCQALQAKPHVAQRTSEWYAQTKNVLTASEFSNILSTPRMVGTLVLQKVLPREDEEQKVQSLRLACATLEMSAMDWGVRLEPVVKQFLLAHWGAEIVDVGRILHPTDPRLAASPDGLILNATEEERVGRLIEIKCPVRREITGKIPFEYWCQMQIQMEVTGIDQCDYIEVKINSAYKDQQTFKEPEAGSLGAKHRGVLWLFQEPNTLELKYAYTEEEREHLSACGWCEHEEIPWSIDSFYTTTVHRDRQWFEGTKAKRDEFWEKVAAARAGMFELPPSQRKPRAQASVQPTIQVCKIED